MNYKEQDIVLYNKEYDYTIHLILNPSNTLMTNIAGSGGYATCRADPKSGIAFSYASKSDRCAGIIINFFKRDDNISLARLTSTISLIVHEYLLKCCDKDTPVVCLNGVTEKFITEALNRLGITNIFPIYKLCPSNEIFNVYLDGSNQHLILAMSKELDGDYSHSFWTKYIYEQYHVDIPCDSDWKKDSTTGISTFITNIKASNFNKEVSSNNVDNHPWITFDPQLVNDKTRYPYDVISDIDFKRRYTYIGTTEDYLNDNI